MAEEIRTEAQCRCGRTFIRIQNSIRPTWHRNGDRFVYRDRPDEGWSVFRCDACDDVVPDLFSPLQAGIEELDQAILALE